MSAYDPNLFTKDTTRAGSENEIASVVATEATNNKQLESDTTPNKKEVKHNGDRSFGASQEEWDHFGDMLLGLSEDLLPVVSNPNAEISPDSKMRDLGKTPSFYNKNRKVAGIQEWTDFEATIKDIAGWSLELDYGICLQTRLVRGIDIDVEDQEKATAIADFIHAHLGLTLPKRARGNSGKCLLAVRIPGELPYRKIIVDGGVVELLSDGKQFIAAGMHKSDVRYEWAGGLPVDFPTLTLDQFTALWQALANQFAGGESSEAGSAVRKRGEHIDMPDPVADMLELVSHGTDRDGALIITCPWDAEHTSGSVGDGSTVWFRAGSNGYAQGHFKCLHAHCAGRTDSEFFVAIDYVEDTAADFEVIEASVGEVAMPSFKRTKNGEIEAKIENLTMAIKRADFCGMTIKRDDFRDELMFHRGDGQWQNFADSDYPRLQLALEKKDFKPISSHLLRDVVPMIADDNRFDSAIEWINRLKWDGVPRVENFMRNYFGTEDTPYTRAVSRYTWSAMAGRVISPGCKADMVPILVGAQGAGKSLGVAAMAPSPEHFCEISFHEKDDDLARKMRGSLLAEIGELRGLHTKELEGIKAFITRTHEKWIPKYKEFSVQYPRRIFFIGTTNQSEFLADSTGNRRWLPLDVFDVKVDDIKRDMLQLWAEGAVLFKQSGVAFLEAEKLATEVHGKYEATDTWTEEVDTWLESPAALTDVLPTAKGWVTISEILVGCLGYEAKNIGRREQVRMGDVLRGLGYRNVKRRYITGKDPFHGWVKDGEIPF